MDSDQDSSTISPQERVTLAWLFRHVTLGAWLSIGGILCGAVALGFTVGKSPYFDATTQQENVQLPPTKLPDAAAKDVKEQIEALVAAHNARMEALTTAYIQETRKAADGSLIYTDQQAHEEAANKLQDAIDQERRTLQTQIAAIRAMIKGESE